MVGTTVEAAAATVVAADRENLSASTSASAASGGRGGLSFRGRPEGRRSTTRTPQGVGALEHGAFAWADLRGSRAARG